MAKRFVSMGAAVALAMSLGFVAATSAGAATGPKGKTTCSNISGNANTTVTVSGCVDQKGANTGGGSHSLSVLTLASGGTVTWNSNKTTTFGTANTVIKPGKKCPGYVKANGDNNPSQVTFKGVVTADTAGMKVPGKYSGAVCVAQDGTITAMKPLKVT